MRLLQYQVEAMRFARYPARHEILYPLLALQEEVGEVSGKFAKHLRKGGSLDAFVTNDDLREPLLKELGDVLWQLAALCEGLGAGLDEVAERNLDKLHGRDKRGTLVGEGDDR